MIESKMLASGEKYYLKTCLMHNTEVAEDEARLAFSLIERWGMISGVDDGEDSAGRAKIRLATPEELVARAFECAKLSLQANSTTTTKTNSSSSYRKLISKGSAKIYQDFVQTIPTGVFTTVNLGSEVYDDEDLFDLGTETYTADHQGFYSIEAKVTYLVSSDQNRYSIKLVKDGTDDIDLTHDEGSGTGNMTVQVNGTYYLDKGAAITMQTRQDSGSNKDLIAGEEFTKLTVTMVRQQ